jgi:hypothetical protein
MQLEGNYKETTAIVRNGEKCGHALAKASKQRLNNVKMLMKKSEKNTCMVSRNACQLSPLPP